MDLKIFKALLLSLLFKFCFNQTGISKTKYICIDDANWLEKTDSSLFYELNCIYNGVTSIKISESILHFSNKIDIPSWLNIIFTRFDCNDEIFKWSATSLNLTFTTQAECDKNKNQILGQGAKCLLSKEFLRSNMFKINRPILETRYDIYPIPYSAHIKYTCN